ncbi:phage tail protein [Rahnella sp. PAMC 25559]|uniref:phage tail-collar fiber domain-containing protein n=1 Tax=Rahnella sp. PAMC 25559 TaxID=3423225 RepID=UPI003D67D78F
MSTFKSVVTTLGQARIAAAIAAGTDINITQLAVGDGNGKATTPVASQTKLVKEVYRTPLNSLKLDPSHGNWVIAEAVLSASIGGFWMREMGLFSSDGALIAVCNMADTYKPTLAEGSGRTQTLRMVIAVSNTEAISLLIDDSVIMATEQYVNDLLAAHEKSRNHPDGTTAAKGFVQLSSSVSSTSEALAATPKAVKAVNDNANTRVPATRKVNNKALNADITLTAADVGALPVASAVLGTTNINTLNLAKIGVYVQSTGANATVANGYPAGSQAAGVLEVMPASWTGGVLQRYTVQNTGMVWTRALNASWNGKDGPWRDWVQASSAGSVAANTALGATDLNTVGFGLSAVQAAVYHQSANASATPDRNYPEAKAGTLFVTGSAYGCQQMYITFDTCNVWMRGLSTNWNGKDGPWRPWVAVYGTNNKPTAADVGAWTASQSAASEKALSDEIATAFKIRTNLTAADTPNTLRGSGMFGHYGVPGVAAATTAKGYPMNGFVGVIFVTWGPNATQQIAFNSNGRQFTRYATGAWNGVDGPWSAWVEVYSPNNKPTPADIGAVPAAGGNVSYLNNASHYGTKPGTWEGAGSFAAQYSNPVAPFIIPSGFGAPKGVSSYSPIIKGMIQTQGLGWATAISFGAYTTGGGNHAQACINVVGDNGVSSAWLFNPSDSSFYSPGDIKSGQYIYATKDVSGAYIASRGDIHAELNISSKGFIQSGAGVYDTPGVRCYSPNYQPTPEAVNAITRDVCSVAGFVSGNANDAYMRNSTTNEVVILARRDWVNGNFITGQRQASAQWSGWIGNGLQVPAGCVVIGARNNGSSNASNLGLLYAAEQICINGNWVTIGLV